MGGGSSSNPAPSTTPTKRGKSTPQATGVAPVLPAPKCQVEGCGVDLTGAKTYYCRHKVCAAHSKSPKVVVAGKEQRFCQQCSRFHQLNEFDHGKRSCRRRLAGHNERRRKPPPGLPSSQYGHLPYIHEYGSRSQCFVVDFTTPNLPANARPTVGAGNQLPHSQDQVPINFATPNRGSIQDDYANTYGQGSAGKVVFNDPHLDPHQSLGVTDSNCALSLLSGQPLGTSSLTGQVPVLSQNSSHGFQMSEPSMLTNLVDSCNAHGIPYHMSLGQPSETGYPQFSANFEPASLVTNQYTDSGYGRTYESSSNLMHNGLHNPRY